MKSVFRSNQGFSLVELLVALLILAVIIAVAVVMLGGVLNSTKAKADRESADNIAMAIQSYMHVTQDEKFTMVKVVPDTTTKDLIKFLAGQLKIEKADNGTLTLTWYKYDKSSNTAIIDSSPITLSNAEADVPKNISAGTYGPFLDGARVLDPQQKGYKWVIDINTSLYKATVEAKELSDETKVTKH